MSNTSDRHAAAVQAIKDLRNADETPGGEQGDQFDAELDEHAEAVLARIGAIVDDTDTVTADVDNSSTDTEELSVTFPNGDRSTETGLLSLSDEDGTTPLSINTGDLGGTYDIIIVEGIIEGTHSGVNIENLRGTVNNHTSDSYTTSLRGGGSSGGGYWVDGFRNPGYLSLKWRIQAHNNFGDYARSVSVRSMSGGHASSDRMVDGFLNASIPPVDSIQLTTPSNAKGRVKFYGRNIR